MKIGAVGFGNRIAHVYFELKEINKDAQMIAFVDPTPIGKKFAIEKNIFPSKQYNSLEEMLGNEELDLLIADNDLQFIEHSVNEIINEDEIDQYE